MESLKSCISSTCSRGPFWIVLWTFRRVWVDLSLLLAAACREFRVSRGSDWIDFEVYTGRIGILWCPDVALDFHVGCPEVGLEFEQHLAWETF